MLGAAGGGQSVSCLRIMLRGAAGSGQSVSCLERRAADRAYDVETSGRLAERIVLGAAGGGQSVLCLRQSVSCLVSGGRLDVAGGRA